MGHLSDTLRATLERQMQGANLDPVQKAVIDETLRADEGGADVFDPAVQQSIATAAGETRFQPEADEPTITPTAGVATAGPQPGDIVNGRLAEGPVAGSTNPGLTFVDIGEGPTVGVGAEGQQFFGDRAGAREFLEGLGLPTTDLDPAQSLSNLVRRTGAGQTAATGATPSQAQSRFGFAPGAVPGGDALQFLRDIGFPFPSTFGGLQTGRPLQGGDLGRATQQLGNLGIPSPQSLGNLDDTGLQLLISIFETLLGVPFGDIQSAGLRPFQGLRSGPQGRSRLLG